MPIKILFLFGTRPEAIKLSPVVLHMRSRLSEFSVRVAVTAQHRRLLDQVLATFDIRPDYDLDLMRSGQSLLESSARILAALEDVLNSESPQLVLVQGDTTTTLCGALGAFYKNVPVGHVEAGLRTGDLRQPFPEEMNRVVTTRLASLHFAATQEAARNLCAEGVDSRRIAVTGNSGIDAVLYVREGLEQGRWATDGENALWTWLDDSKKLIVVTAHRRESFGEGFERICAALSRLAERGDIQIVFPVHPNPNAHDPVCRYFSNHPNILLTEPLEYVPFIDLMGRAYFVMSDSGGIQEEAPALGKPVLVLREKTERSEAVDAGTVRLVGTDVDCIVREAHGLLDSPAAYQQMSRVHNPYGDGRASERIARAILSFFNEECSLCRSEAGRCRKI
jgi:UDP-N-acetylglucosamine 2-epimerase (non-hydrolysing)